MTAEELAQWLRSRHTAVPGYYSDEEWLLTAKELRRREEQEFHCRLGLLWENILYRVPEGYIAVETVKELIDEIDQPFLKEEGGYNDH